MLTACRGFCHHGGKLRNNKNITDFPKHPASAWGSEWTCRSREAESLDCIALGEGVKVFVVPLVLPTAMSIEPLLRERYATKRLGWSCSSFSKELASWGNIQDTAVFYRLMTHSSNHVMLWTDSFVDVVMLRFYWHNLSCKVSPKNEATASRLSMIYLVLHLERSISRQCGTPYLA
jgi:hypothetical protein